ncbi:hypothetical protein [Azospirillum sp. sgz302134]
MSAGSQYQGKRGANAGDEYHELWALRRALELLRPGTRLRSVTVEGVLVSDESGVAAATWDGVDAACYYGDDDDTVDRVELIQLKYSGADPNAAWTISRLAHADNKHKTNSIIARLATAWAGMRKQRPAVAAAGQIVVRLVSNQPVAPEVLNALSNPTSTVAQRLQTASGLSAGEFASFTAALDLTGCGDGSRFSLEERVIDALSEIRDGDVRNDLYQLREFIRERMRPEGQGQSITAESIFGLFGHADPHSFFPCPLLIQQVDRLIRRAATDRIIEHFTAGDQKLCLHGGGGEGKTTVLQDLADKLPPQSELIVYDCYGEGTYLDANSYRHRPADAFLQLANECAARFLLPPVFTDRQADHPRRFVRKLELAAAALAARDPNALLVVAVDAADIAVTAAALCVPAEVPFVHAFVRLGSLPPNVRLLVSARTGRLDTLDLPEAFKPVPLQPFTLTESTQFARGHFAHVDDSWCAEFHAQSGGNPRVERYAIKFAQGDADRALDYLNPHGRNLDGIFAARLDEAIVRSGAPRDVSRLCAALTGLPRPVPLKPLAAAAGITNGHAHDIVLDLVPGLRFEDAQVGFADEDFEAFVRSRGSAMAAEVTTRAADYLLATRQTDSYAAVHAASLALADGRRDMVLALAQEDPQQLPITDPAERGEVHRRRLQIAMHVCRNAGNTVDAAALLLQGAHALRTDEAVRRTLSNHIELAAHFSRERIIALVLRDRERRREHGKLLLHLVGVDGAAGNRVGARANARAFMAWQESRVSARESASNDDDNSYQPERWVLNPDDVAAMIVGRLYCDGGEAAWELIRHARPIRFRHNIFVRVVRRLIRRGDVGLINAVYAHWPKRHSGRHLLAFALGLLGQPVDAAALLTALTAHVGVAKVDLKSTSHDYSSREQKIEHLDLILDACDLIVMQGGDRAAVKVLLEPFCDPGPRAMAALAGYSPYMSDLAARAFALRAALNGYEASFEDFAVAPPPAPPSSAEQTPGGRRPHARQPQRDNTQADREKASAVFKPLIALYMTRARIVTGDVAPADAPAALAEVVNALQAARRQLYRNYEWRQRDDHAARALLVLGALPSVDAAALFAPIGDMFVSQEGMVRFGISALLNNASQYLGFRQPLINLVVESADDVCVRKMPADEKIDFIVGLAEHLLPLDQDAALYCFNAAIAIAGEVDIEALHAIRVARPLAIRAQTFSTAQVRAAMASKLAAVVQDAAVRLGTNDHFPWEDVARALAALSAPVALATSARFVELQLVRHVELLTSILEALAEANALDHTVLAALLPILNTNGETLAQHLLTHSGTDDNDARTRIAELVARHVLLEPLGSAENFASFVTAVNGRWTEALHATARFEEKRPSTASDSMLPEHASIEDAIPASALSITGIVDVESFVARIDAIPEKEVKSDDWRMHASKRTIAEGLLAQVPRYRVGTFLDIISQLPISSITGYDIASWLLRQLGRWDDVPAAQNWARTRLLGVIEARLPEFVRSYSHHGRKLGALLAQTKQPDAVLCTRILAAIEQHIDELSAPAVFQMIGVLAAHMTDTEAAAVLDSHLDRLLACMEPEDRRLPGFEDIPHDNDEAIVRFLFAELGSIAVPHRWRAAHAVRFLATLGRTDLLERLVEVYARDKEPCFGHPTAPFYALAARVWLMLALARIAWDTPAAVTRFKDWLLTQGERADFPHLLLRFLAKQALLGLAAANPELLSPDEQQRITVIAESLLPRIPSKQKSYEKGFDRHQPPGDEGRRFRFDSLDTLPYWYTPLMRCFADPNPAYFLERAEHWIIDRWGAAGETWDYDKLRGNGHFNRGGRDVSSNRHGSLPEIERYRTYLEWHAMFTAGGEVLSEWPLTSSDEDSWDQFSDWIVRQAPTMAPLWLSDLRGPKPLEPVLWWPPHNPQTWLAHVGSADIREVLALDDPEWLVISSYTLVHHGKLVGSTVRVESALVSRENATALRLALEASENSYQYRIAVNHDHQIASGRFVLASLLVDRDGETGLDRHDMLRGEVDAPSQLPHSRVIEALALTRDPTGLPIWRDGAGTPIIRSLSWSDPMRAEHEHYGSFGNGTRLMMRRESLAQLLDQEGLDLLTNLTIRRRSGNDSEGWTEANTEREFDYIIIFRADGTIEARQGDLGRWR